MPYIIAQPCIGEKAAECVMVCPVDCIHEGEDQYYIDPDVCIECGSCQSVCPVEAVYRDDELPEEWKDFEKKNSQFFNKSTGL